jgi:chromosomal replication initiation ATPase DnaA
MDQLTLDLHLPPNTHQDLILGNCNFSAFQWIERWPQWPTFVMALYGPVLSGKSYFAQFWQKKTQASLWDIETFEKKSWDQHLFDTEQTHFCIQGIPKQEQNFFHFFNALQQKKGYLLLTDNLPPAHWNITLPDLKSRLNAVPTLGITQPEEDFLNTLLIKLFSDKQLKIPQEMIDFIVLRLPRSFKAAHLIVQYIDETVEPISFSLLKKILEKILQDPTL